MTTTKFWQLRILLRVLFGSFALLISACSTTSTGGGVSSPSGAFSTKTKSGDLNEKIADRKNPVIPRGIDYTYPPARIAFGSCADQDRPQPMWTTIYNEDPDLFIFTGDNVYASRPEQQPIADQYIKLDQIPEYRKFREEIPMMAIWDDHDYGLNDGGRENPEKEIARRDFLSYWMYVRDSIALGQGPLYHAKMIGGPVYTRIEKRRGRRGKARKAKIVSKPGSSVQVIMLDTRWNRTPLTKSDGSNSLRKFEPTNDPKATILGAQQWDWLEDQLAKKADIKILVSSIQVIADGHGFEKWGNFPQEKQKLYNLIKKTNPKNLFIVSGDRHIGTIAKADIPGWGTLYDITASSINKPSDLDETDTAYIGTAYNRENYGFATIDWQRKLIQLELKDLSGKQINTVELPLR